MIGKLIYGSNNKKLIRREQMRQQLHDLGVDFTLLYDHWKTTTEDLDEFMEFCLNAARNDQPMPWEYNE